MATRIVMLAYPQMDQMDLTGPYEVFARLPDCRVQIVWKNRKPVRDSLGLTLVPDTKFSKVKGCDVLCVPGGPGQITLMEDEETLDFLRRMARTASYVTSVCTGSLVLGAAGLLMGYKATCHWLSLEQLSLLGAIPVAERVVVDRDRMTCAGVTSGIDFALMLARELAGENEARRISLAMEYDPRPPFPGLADEDSRLVEEVRLRTAAFQEQRVAVARAAGQRLLSHPDLP